MALVKATTLSIPGLIIEITEEEGYCLYDAIYRDTVEAYPEGLQSLRDELAGALFGTAPPDADEVPF